MMDVPDILLFNSKGFRYLSIKIALNPRACFKMLLAIFEQSKTNRINENYEIVTIKMGIQTLHILIKFYNTPRESEIINPHHTSGLFLYPLKILKIFWLFDFFYK